jgi:hypothetical protein
MQLESDQFADTADVNQGFSNVPEWCKIPIAKWYISDNPEMSLKQTMMLTKIASPDTIGDTNSEHFDLLQLMKQYEI